MTAIGDKLKDAGVDTLGAKITTLVIEGIRFYPNSVVDVWRFVGERVGYDLIRIVMKDMGVDRRGPEKSPMSPLGNDAQPVGGGPKKSLDDYRRERERREKEKAERDKRKARVIVMFKSKTYDGRDWAEVGAHELPGMARQGGIARELIKELPELAGGQKYAELRELITQGQFDAAQKRAGQ